MNSGTHNDHPSRRHPAHHPPIERHNQPVIIHLIVCTYNRRKILAAEKVHLALLDAWNSSNQWMVGRYVIMPDHIHIFCSPVARDHENISKWVTYWKRATSRALPELQPIWQRDCWDTQLRRHESYTEKWHYVLNNPVRKGLVEDTNDWPFKGELNVLMW